MSSEISVEKFKIGDVLRYSRGRTALFQVSSISLNHSSYGQHRYYGDQFYGGSMGAYEPDCSLATAKETEEFNAERRKRVERYESYIAKQTGAK